MKDGFMPMYRESTVQEGYSSWGREKSERRGGRVEKRKERKEKGERGEGRGKELSEKLIITVYLPSASPLVSVLAGLG